MTFTYSVSFEYPSRAPDTATGTVEAGNAGTAARRALGAARKSTQARGWMSVVVLLQKAEDAAGEDSGAS